MITNEDIEKIVENIEKGWQDEMNGSQSFIDFKNYSPFDTLLRKNIRWYLDNTIKDDEKRIELFGYSFYI